MSALNELLEYQAVDGELLKIEQELSASEERKKYGQAKKFMESAPEKLEAQDKRAVELRHMVKDLTAKYEELKETIAEYSAMDEDVEDDGQISFYKRSAQKLSDQLRALKGEIAKLIAEIESTYEEYKKMKEKTILMQKQYKEYREKYQALKAERAGEVEKITKRLNELSANIPAPLLEKYKIKRKEKIFPILVPLKDDRCGHCRFEFSVVLKSQLSGGNVVECEHCSRFVYQQ